MNQSDFFLFRNNGFTLIELTIVIIIIGVIASITPVIITNYLTDQDLEIETSKLISSINYLQQISSNGDNSKINFNTINQSYTIFSNNNSETVYLSKNVFFYQTPAYIKFDKKGISENISGDTIILSNTKKKSYIIIKKITGDIDFFKIK
ncbi:prepilin-type N-terminal cleavage/methylation domain-containing protein [Candidatus Dependentiae bacterium]|nr:prepilin-type N-terminal cleavage/methylation domain-containing protein [Candidatus Dependentiae bacterium]